MELEKEPRAVALPRGHLVHPRLDRKQSAERCFLQKKSVWANVIRESGMQIVRQHGSRDPAADRVVAVKWEETVQ